MFAYRSIHEGHVRLCGESVPLWVIGAINGRKHPMQWTLLHVHSQKRHRLVASCQFYRLVWTCQQFHQVAANLLRSGLLQLVICRLVTTCWNNLQQLGSSLLTTCNRFVVNNCCCKLCERILISACWQQTCCNLRVFGCVDNTVIANCQLAMSYRVHRRVHRNWLRWTLSYGAVMVTQPCFSVVHVSNVKL